MFESTATKSGRFSLRGESTAGAAFHWLAIRGGRGVAVVRIEDQKGGREGYTFDLEWRGNSGAMAAVVVDIVHR